MKYYIKTSMKVFTGYGITLLTFAIVAYAYLSLAGKRSAELLPYFSLLFFLFVFTIIYTDIGKLAEREKRPQYDLNPYPLKGLVYGFIGFSPIIILEIVSLFLVFDNVFANRVKELVLNFLMGPEFFIIKAFSEKPVGYVIASFAIPIVAMLGYLAGFYGFKWTKYLKKSPKNIEKTSFSKSPWNPTNRVSAAPVKKKKKVTSVNKAE